jgi:hypothetical protein
MESIPSGSLRIDQFTVCHTGALCLHGAPLRSISFDAHHSMRQVAETSSPTFTLRCSGTSVQEFLNGTPDSTSEPYLFFHRGDLRLASTLRSGGAPPQNYLSGLCLIDSMLHSINRDENCGILAPGKSTNCSAAQSLAHR